MPTHRSDLEPPSFFPWLPGELASLHAQGLIRKRRRVTPLPDGWCEIDGRRLRNFSSNDYLNLAHDRRVIEAAKTALDRAGAGSGASALVTGRTDWHVRLEERLAEFEGQEAAVLFPTGYAANLGTIATLVGPGDVVFCDRLNHASLIDGCRLSGAELRVYRHDNLETLRRELSKAADSRRRLIVTDSLFSMDGDAAPLPELCDLAERHDAALSIDEAHATGIFGRLGRGVAEHLQVEDRVAVRIGTLSKAIGALGGFVAGPQTLIDWLWNRARTQMFSTAPMPAACAAAFAAVEIISRETWRREQLLARADQLRRLVQSAGLRTTPNCVGPIIPIILNEPRQAVQAAARLEEQGLLVAAIRPPTVPQGTSRLRITLSCAHSQEDVQQLAGALSRLVELSAFNKNNEQR